MVYFKSVWMCVFASACVCLGVRLRWAEADGILLSVSICRELWPLCLGNNAVELLTWTLNLIANTHAHTHYPGLFLSHVF